MVATLATIEDTTTTAYVKTEPVADEDDPDAPLIANDEKATLKVSELLVVKSQPITARLRTTIQHLRARAGFFSRFRGLEVVLVYGLLHNLLTDAFIGVLPAVDRTVPCVSAVLSAMLLARLPMTWTHVVISEPSDKRWFRRIPGFKSWLQILPATALWATAEQLTVALPNFLYAFFGLARWSEDPASFGEVDEATRKIVVMQSFAVCAVAIGTAVLILIPATVTLKRVQASLLPEEDEAIVPFDRTFGGKVVPEIVGGTGKLGLMDAWKTFDWAARIRLLKVYVKTFAMQVALTTLFAGVIFAELYLIMGDELQKMMKAAQSGQTGGALYEIEVIDN